LGTQSAEAAAARGVHLEEADDAEDLHLRRRRQRVPLIGRRARRRDVAEADRREVGRQVGAGHRALDVPREVDAVLLDDVADEAGHRDAAVLDLGVAEPADRLGQRLVVGDAQRVPESEDRVLLLRELLQAGAVLRLGRRAPAAAVGHGVVLVVEALEALVEDVR
jgi:hypothetical protein